MLRTQLRLSPAACRAARLRPAVRIGARWQSTNTLETAAGTASDAGPPPFPRSTPAPSDRPRAHALYTVTPLPPMPPPLPADISSADTVLHSGGTSSLAPGVTIAHQAPAAAEQLAILGACLSSGDVARAEEVAKRIRTQWARAGNVGSLSTLLPPRVHTDFLKAYFVRAILPRSLRSPGATESLAKSFEGLNLPPSNATSTEASVDKSVAPLSTASRRSIHKAWTYFDSLFGSQWDAVDPLTQRTRRGHNGAIDASVIAVMLKGVTSLGFDVYNPTSLSDPDRIFRPITYLLPVLRQTGIDLLDVVRDPIFDIDLPSYLGKCSREQALDALEKTGKGREGWDEWQAVIDEVKREVERLREGREKEAKERKAVEELDPVVAPNTDVNVSLETLRTSLGTLSVPLSDSVMSRTNRQRLLEESSYDAARQLYIHEMEELAKVGKDRERGLQRGWLQSIMFDWHRKLSTALYDASCATGKSSPWGKEPDIEPFLRLLPTDKMALITIVELMRLCGGGGVSDGMKAARAVLTVGRAVESEYHAEALKEAYTNKELQDEISRISESGAIGPDGRLQNRSQEESLGILWRRELAKREQAGDTAWRPTWTQTIRAKVGSILVSTLMDIAHVERTARHPQTGETLTEMQPAFSHAYQYVRGQKLGIIKVNPVVAERLDQDPLSMTLHPRYLPMLVQPKPWLSWNSGAYLLHQTQMMRTKDSDEQLQYLQQASDNDTLDTIFTGLDALGSVSWQINRRVFDVVSTVWNAGEAIADIPNKDSLVDPVKAPLPENVETDPRARDTYRHRIRQALQARREAHSKRCDLNYKLEIARAFLDEKFYFPHNLDFRGRAYPIPPNLSHIGDDMCRGLLMFGEAKPLGERGLRWLKIHAANLCGYDKASFDERERWTMEHLEDIFDSADKPLDGQRWWLKADDPWQCLATCIELTNALRSEVPTDYACALPVHQDGTCNGLQHYAALGGDLKGAHQVNLDAGDRPADVYSGVASMVNEIIDRDAADGVAEAEILKGKVTRKVVKQTVMTTVYGVTFIGAKNQIQRQLKDRGDVPAEHLYACSLYLGRLVLDSIGDLFKGASGIQTWLNRCARLIAKSIPPQRIEAALQQQKPRKTTKRGVSPTLSRIPKEQMTSVIWTTPLGLPVVQPYRRPKKKQVSTALQTVFIVDPSIPAEVDARAQATAFPPNFIHSLDATHMMMTALACKDKISFASVHDSYWTHACDVDEMSTVLRDTFIELHSQDILGRLRQEFIERYAGHVVPVSKIPPGLRAAGMNPDAASPLAKPVENAEAVISELEAEDGPGSLSLFAQAGHVKRVGRSPTTDAWSVDGLDAEEGDMAKVWKGQTSTRTDSKLIYLADVLPPPPGKGDFDLEKIRDSSYFFN
ncbi:putative DNA-directed RNA polymerase [Rhodotorula taiwanensis]|uniref:DNA-directed RNA polymerase n=1 Tax=Rhodotorula taiwanensis TaxID=741276 RepID=A0A2S5B833_9BASI|nr:putative DNA-directed RNA polymerase [Rhodotorula taiwanensis]